MPRIYLPDLKNVLLLGLLALLLAACDTAVPAVSAAPTGDNILPESVAPELVASPVAPAEATAVPPVRGNGGNLGQNAPSGNGAAPGNGNGPGNGDPVLPAGDLSSAEIAALQFMREEEKLARDVYQALYAVWGVPVFDNIAASEQAHMDSVGYLLDSYGLEDPAAGQPAGVFTNPDLQALHDRLLAQGSQSLAGALSAGGAIEETDILDLQEGLAQTQNTAVAQVFQNLLAGSENHLRAFATNYQRQTGAAYQPQVMSQDAYQAILNGTSGRGVGPGAGGGLGRPEDGGGLGRGSGGQGGPTNGRGGPGNGNTN